MHRLSSIALSIALVVSSGFGLSVNSAWAATKAKSAKTHQTAVPIPRAKPKVVQASEGDVTADLNRQSVRDAQKEAVKPDAGPVEAKTPDAGPVEASAAPAMQDETPLIRRLPQTYERFTNSDKITRKGWTSTLGLLPEPDTKISIPSPDVRLQERGLRFGAIYRF